MIKNLLYKEVVCKSKIELTYDVYQSPQFFNVDLN